MKEKFEAAAMPRGEGRRCRGDGCEGGARARLADANGRVRPRCRGSRRPGGARSVIAEAEAKSASLEEEVAKARTPPSRCEPSWKASPAEEGFKWKNPAAKLRLDKNEAVKELAAKREIESVRAELNRRTGFGV